MLYTAKTEKRERAVGRVSLNGVVRGENYASSRVHNVRCAGYRWSVLRSRVAVSIGFRLNGVWRSGRYAIDANRVRCDYRYGGNYALSYVSGNVGFR